MGEGEYLKALATVQVDATGKVPGDVDYVGPFVVPKNESGVVQSAGTATDPVHTVQIGKVCIASITETDLTDNVYTVTGGPATRLDGLKNKGVGVMTVTLDTGIVLSLDPGDVYNDIDLYPFTTLTFSAGAEFKAMICR